jgi:N-acetylglucosamine-6-sulfatase
VDGSSRPRLRALLALGAVVLVAACSSGPLRTLEAEPGPVTTSQSPPRAKAPEPARRPNLLVIEADDMRSDDLRWMPRTRRQLAGRGLTWHNSFAPDPLCCPSRASFLTGQYSHNHQVLSHEPPYGFAAFRDRVTLATVLHDAGYRTALVGKYLNGYGMPPDGPGDRDQTYVPPGWSRWVGALDLWRDADGRYLGSTYDYFHLAANVDGRLRHWPGKYSTTVLGEQTRALVTDLGERPRAPWFLWWTPVAPHHGNPVEPDDPPPVRYRKDGSPVLWQSPARPDGVEGLFDREIARGLGVPRDGKPEPDLADKPRYLRAQSPLTDADLAALTEVTRQRAEALHVLDEEVAHTLRRLRRTGQAGRTVVVLTSDNGYYLGEHGKRQGKITLHEPSVRVPLLMAGPGIPHGHRHDPVTTIDLSTTVAAWAGVRLPRADGTDLRSIVEQGDQGWDRPVVLEGRMLEPTYLRASERRPAFGGLGTLGMRTGRWKYVRYATGEHELYDLLHDPLELESIAEPRPWLRRLLDRTWRRSVACAARECRDQLPERLRLTAAEGRRITRLQEAAVDRYYGRGG